MATNFGNTIMEGQIAPSVQVQAPVQDNSAAVFANALQPVANAAGSIFGSLVAGNQENQRAGVLSGLNNYWLDIADSVEQGERTPQQARMLIRQSFREYTANDPTLYEDINKLHATFLTSSGMGNIIDEGTPEQQALDTIRNESAQLGMTVDQYMQRTAAVEQLAALNRRVEYTQAQGNIITETDRLEGINIATNLARTSFPIAQTEIENAMRRIEANPSQKAQIVQELNDWFGVQITQWQSMTGPMDIDYITTPIEGLRDTFNSWANNTVSTANMQASIANTQSTYDLMYNLDPDMARWAAEARVINSVGLSDSMGHLLWDQPSISKLFENIGPNARTRPADLLDGSDASNRVIQNTRQIAQELLTSDDEQARQELYQNINRMVDGIYTNSIGIDDPLAFQKHIEDLSSPEVRAFVESMGGLDSRYSEQAMGVLRQQYEAALLPAVANKWYEESVFQTDTTQMDSQGRPFFTPNANGLSAGPTENLVASDVAEPRWNGSAVEFVVKEEYRDNQQIINYVQGLNTGEASIAIPLNNLINMYSLISGEEPSSIWQNDIQERVFGVRDEFVEDVRSTVDDLMGYAPMNEGLTLEAFNEQVEVPNIEQLAADNPAIAAIQGAAPLDDSTFVEPTSNPGVNPDVLSRYAGSRLPVSIRNNNMGAISITGSVENSWAARQPGFVGTSPRPANEGGFYAKYATPEHGVAAASRLLENYGNQGVNTPLAIVTKWSADRSAHATYANTLVRYLNEAGISASPSAPLNLSDPMVRFAVLKAKSAHEAGAGRPVYNDEVFLRGVSYQI